jgi:hypothetical protein
MLGAAIGFDPVKKISSISWLSIHLRIEEIAWLSVHLFSSKSKHGLISSFNFSSLSLAVCQKCGVLFLLIVALQPNISPPSPLKNKIAK